MSARARRYCGRVGIVAAMADDEECIECGRLGRLHPLTPRLDECGWFAATPCSCGPRAHTCMCGGGPCILPVGHDGAHTLERS